MKSTRAPVAPAPLDEAVEGAEPVGVERRGRLVEQQDGGVGQHRDREAEPLDHAARVGADRRGAPAPLSEAKRSTSSVRSAATPRRRAVELDDLAAGEGVGKGDLLRQEREVAPRRRLAGRRGGLAEQHLARRRPDQAGRGLERRRLARAVRAEQRDDLAALDVESVSASHRDVRAEALPKPAKRIIAVALQRPTSAAARQQRAQRRRAAPRDAGRAGPADRGRGTSGRAGGARERRRGPRPAPASSTGKARSAAPSAGAAKLCATEVGGGEVAAEVVEDGREPVRAVAAAVAVEVGLVVVGPVVAVEDACRCGGPTSVSGVRLPTKELPSKRLLAAGVVEHDRHVGLGDDVAAEDVAVRALEEDAARVVGDQVVLGDDVVAGLEQQADRGEAAVVEEPVAPEDDPLRVHERRAGGAVLEDVVLEEVVVGEHVVQPVAQVARRGCRGSTPCDEDWM